VTQERENLMGLQVFAAGDPPQLMAEFRLEGGKAVPVGDETRVFLQKHREGIYDNKTEKFITPDDGKVYLQTLAKKFALCAGTVLKPIFGDGE
jgi:hypothetical protein